MKTSRETARLEGYDGSVNSLAVLPDGRLASGSHDPSVSWDKTIRLWDVRTGREMARLEGHVGSVSALAVLPDGRLASASDDRTMRLWDAGSGAQLARLEVDFAVICLAVLGVKRLAAGDLGGRIQWLEIVD